MSDERVVLPPFLKAGDRVGVTCPSGYLSLSKTVFARQKLEQWGFRVSIGTTVGCSHFYLADTDDRRREGLQQLLDDPDISAIMMGRGGYGASRIVDRLDFSEFEKNPKWIIGFSDITVLHSHIQRNYGIATVHGPMCGAFKDQHPEPAHLTALRNLLTGSDRVHYPIPVHALNRPGTAEGVLVGGNLAILAHLTGSVSQIETKGKILFIEDVGEYLYNVDRMLLNLKRSGMLSGLAGLICGGFTAMEDTVPPFGMTLPELVMDCVREYDFPVCFDFPAGHIEQNYPLCLGKKHRLVLSENEVLFTDIS